MSDNTLLNLGNGGDLIRTIAKTANTQAKTEVVTLDVGGGADSSPESITGSASGTRGGVVSIPVFDAQLSELLHICTQILAVLKAMHLQDASFQSEVSGTQSIGATGVGVVTYVDPTEVLTDTFN